MLLSSATAPLDKKMTALGERDKLGIWNEQIHTTIFKIDNKDLLYSTGNYIQYLVITYIRL